MYARGVANFKTRQLRNISRGLLPRDAIFVTIDVYEDRKRVGARTDSAHRLRIADVAQTRELRYARVHAHACRRACMAT